ncbi:MAG: hypothetical protein OEY74_03990 [Gammaproteobacteria bacterium]|nr:hypothetical protein [Gammaproteobacteria bacterium]
MRRAPIHLHRKSDPGAIRPKRGMAILDQYRACFEDDTYLVCNRVAKDVEE